MNLIEKYRSDMILALLFIESMFLTVIVEDTILFWFIFIVSAATTFVYSLLILNISPRSFLDSERKYDALFLVFMTAMLNANVVIFPNRIVILIVFVVYFLGLRYLVDMFRVGPVDQIKKNALSLSIFLTVFLGSNFLFNLLVSFGKGGSGIVLVLTNVILFLFLYYISYYNFVRNKVAKKWGKVYSLVLALILTQLSLLTSFYLEKYPSIYKAENTSGLAVTTTPLFIIVVYYCVYGLMIHKLEKKIYPRIIFEYVGTAFVIILTLLATINWGRA